MERHKSVDDYVRSADHWKEELSELRRILLSTKLEETIKWGGPCYTFDGKNVVGLGAFKLYCGLWFFQGALLKDSRQVLINAQKGRTKAMRQWRFASIGDISEIKPRVITAYVTEAIEIARDGREIKAEFNKPVVLPPELSAVFTKNKRLKEAFSTMPLGKRREYAQFIADARREDTKTRRLEKILPMILAGQGLNDKYRT